MKEEYLISIIVPCYNIEKLVASTVKTICSQTYQNLEIILVNDGSTDETAQVLVDLEKTDNRIRVIHKENGGVTSARIEGVRAAKGEWIGFVDGDDAIDPDMYERLMQNAVESKADISHCGYQMVFPSRVDYYYNTGLRAEHDKITGLQELLSGSRIEPGLCNKLFHKTLFHSLLHNSMMDMSIKNYEDLLMNYYLFREANKSVYEDFCPYHYMVRKGSAATSVVNEHKLRDPLRVLKIIQKDTAQCQDVQSVVDKRIAVLLVNLSTMPAGKQKELIEPYRKAARKELQTMAIKMPKGSYGIKQRIQIGWAAIWPWSYMVVHKLYSYLRGTNKKYAVE